MYGVLVIEMQKDVIPRGAVLDIGEMGRAIIPRIQKLLNAAREKGVPVIYANACYFAADPSTKKFPPHCMPGTPGMEVIDELKPKDEDYIVNRARMDSFLYSNLEFILKMAGVNTLLITGITTDSGCLLTAMGAFQRGFEVILVSDCCASWNKEKHQMGLNYLKPFAKILTADEALDLLGR